MAKKPKPETPDTWIDDARQRIENVLYMPFEYSKESVNEVLKIIHESKTEKEYFDRVENLKI